MNTPHPSMIFFASAAKGLVSVVAEELRALGVTELREHPAGVHFAGELATGYRACLWLRSASRVLAQIALVDAGDVDRLYLSVREQDWSRWLDPGRSFAVSFHGANASIKHTGFGAQKVKDAIVDAFQTRHGRRPLVDPRQPEQVVHVHLSGANARIALDLIGGDALHHRGYRQQAGDAPLRETLAAGLLWRAGWPAIAEEGGAFLDPMCGSGTLLIEAAWMAGDVAPGLMRRHWALAYWPGHDAALWDALREEARIRRDKGLARLPVILGFDRDARMLPVARGNLERAGLAEHVKIAHGTVDSLHLPEDRAASGLEKGLMLTNPPYGERLDEVRNMPALYAALGETMRRELLGWEAALILPKDAEAWHLGWRAYRAHEVFNGALECRLLRFHVREEQKLAPRVEDDGSAARLVRACAAMAESEGARMVANRLRKNLKELGRWAAREGVSCYRVYDADMPEYSLAIDLYHDAEGKRWVNVQEYAAPAKVPQEDARRRLREAVSVLPEVLHVEPEQIFLRVRERQRGESQYEKQAERGVFQQVREGKAIVLVNFTDYLDTGLFLDHRVTRGWLGEWAAGKDCLNLFCYTGVASVQMGLGGARSTTSVDMSRTYLDWARRNLELNGLPARAHRLIQADCLAWLDEAAQAAERYDLVFLDPPTFSTSKRMQGTLDVQRDHVAMIRKAMALLRKGGRLVFSNNLQRFKLDEAALADLHIEDVSKASIPRDFVRNPRIHQCWVLAFKA
ncbi:MAG: bifunctional 23S rRNA (guanine(2069)-N(7))-methyltransferase RlmK/23S rRNA (guanine(2445)-N(2))-methyltransferase RlmL [Pseudomonadota bacterium]